MASYLLSSYLKELDNKILKYSQKCYMPKSMAIRLGFWNFKFLFRKLNKNPSFNDDKMHISIELIGGLGDFISSIKYAEGLSNYLGKNTNIDLICGTPHIENLKVLVYEKKYIKNVFLEKKHNYDLEIRLVRFPQVINCYLHRLNEKAQNYIDTLNNFYEHNQMLYKNDFLGICFSLNKGKSRENQADINNLLNLENLDFCLKTSNDVAAILSKFNLQYQKFITLQTGSGICFSKYQTDTRQWNIQNYEKLVDLLRHKYPDYQIIQLGEERQNRIKNVDMDLCGKTSFSELLVLLKSAKLHISQEGGMVILRHFLQGGKSVVLFGPTDEKFYGFPENINISARPCPCPCEWITKNWVKECMFSSNTASCVQNLSPEIVIKKLAEKEI